MSAGSIGEKAGTSAISAGGLGPLARAFVPRRADHRLEDPLRRVEVLGRPG